MMATKVTLQFVDTNGRSLDPGYPLCLFGFIGGVPIPEVGEIVEFTDGCWRVIDRRFHFRRESESGSATVSFVCESIHN